MWRLCNIGVTVWGDSFQALVWGSAREVTGTLWSQGCRKDQLMGQAHAQAFRAHPALD